MLVFILFFSDIDYYHLDNESHFYYRNTAHYSNDTLSGLRYQRIARSAFSLMMKQGT
ncbi:hypothetical protein G6005_20875 [Klebsiella pneumoniae]|uniref:Uncharacterized protein n=1 Tax=Klebsiella pneumoniae 30684/NJST258_2 TaxID=1420013 RepID=W8V1U7_KLEPN|nr:hypothetical protein KPNJ2_05141 [Klebsiella pneumoniae 30684/NJST258_2]AHM87541.1 hypothetical protein KPNJ1_05141 [Klebsiella pneumoniae 30660/NJST258_1]AMA23117.1 hypothetical protein RJF2_01500 [Klebsiella pneumoniae subsp. pneumoniae]APM72857.1 hypothetical protein BB747_26360 [Klebsiella pneumoniae]CDI26764.1 conserved hypothetical protein [Klebsiella pneumoniae subsp. pneumoniae BJ1-GA]BAH61201.1 hypothetical protein KP1_0304 [Klebsiella pneumoniae subsp. pneumoniae NTUH-K2044]